MSDMRAVASGEKGTTINTKSKVKSYRDLLVWQKELMLVKVVYQLTARIPVELTPRL